MITERLNTANACLDLVLIRLHQRLRDRAADMQWTWLYEFSQNRISKLEDRYTELTGRRLNQ